MNKGRGFVVMTVNFSDSVFGGGIPKKDSGGETRASEFERKKSSRVLKKNRIIKLLLLYISSVL